MLPLWVSFGVYIVSIVETIYCVSWDSNVCGINGLDCGVIGTNNIVYRWLNAKET